MQQVVFHVDHSEQWPIAKKNLINLLGENIRLSLLVNGPAVKGYLSEENQDFFKTYGKRVELFACHNSLNGLGIDESALPKNVTVVPIGVKKLIDLQEQGYAYIKP